MKAKTKQEKQEEQFDLMRRNYDLNSIKNDFENTVKTLQEETKFYDFRLLWFSENKRSVISHKRYSHKYQEFFQEGFLGFTVRMETNILVVRMGLFYCQDTGEQQVEITIMKNYVLRKSFYYSLWSHVLQLIIQTENVK